MNDFFASSFGDENDAENHDIKKDSLGDGGGESPSHGESSEEGVDLNDQEAGLPPNHSQPTNNGADRFSAWINNIKSTPKQHYNNAEVNTGTPAGEFISAGEPSQPIAPEYKKPTAHSQRTARMVAKTIDLGFSKSAQMLADAETRDKYKADEEELADIIDAWADYIEAEGMNLPPWLGLLLVNLIVYGLKIPVVLKDRKAAIEIKKQAMAKVASRMGQDDSNPGVLKDEPITVCQHPECGKPLREDQIHKGRSYCSTACSNRHRAKIEKEANKIVQLNSQT